MIRKNFSKKGTTCRVTFKIDGEGVDRALVLGDFNGWQPEDGALERRKDGSYSTTLSIPAGATYRFRYLVDGDRWQNDVDADTLLPNRFGGVDGVLEL